MPRKKSTTASAETSNKTVKNQNSEGAESMDYESKVSDMYDDTSIPGEELDYTDFADGSEPDFDEEKSDSGKTKPSSAQSTTTRQRKIKALPSAPILTIEVGADVITQEEKENIVWHELKNSLVTGSHLTGILGKIERLEKGELISVVDYQGQRLAIPTSEMMLDLHRPEGQSDREYDDRISRVLNRMIGAKLDFVVRGITETDKTRAAVASRKSAMLRLRQRFYLNKGTNGNPQVYPGRIAEARIVAVSRLAIRVEIFGVETSIRHRDLSWGHIGDCRDEYFVGDSINVLITEVNGSTTEDLRVLADVRTLTEDDTRSKLMAMKPRTNSIATVTNVRNGVIYLSLIDGVRAVAHKCFDKRKPGRGDDVLFVCSKVDLKSGTAIGLVSRIVKRNL